MNVNYRGKLPKELDAASRVWIYQSDRSFSSSEISAIEENMEQFTASWLSHGKKVKAHGSLLFEHFIILIADESASGVSGCSTDASVHFIQQMEKQFDVQLLERKILAFLIDGAVQLVPISKLNQAFSDGLIQPDTLFFNNVVLTKKELEDNWIIPLNKSWLHSRIAFPEAGIK